MGLMLGMAAIGMQVAGGVAQAQAAKQQGKDQQAMMEYNARVKEQEAKQIEDKAIFDSQRQAESARRVQSKLQADLGASGAVVTEGSPLLIQAKQASELELDNLMIGYNASIDAGQARNQASLDRMQGKIYRKAGNNAATAAYMNTGASVLTGLNNMGTFDNFANTGNDRYGLNNSKKYNQTSSLFRNT